MNPTARRGFAVTEAELAAGVQRRAAAIASQSRRFLYAFAAIAALVLIVAAVFPRLRLPLSLFSGAAVLLYVRARFFSVPGISGVPFAHFGRLLRVSTQPAAPRKAFDVKSS